MELRRVRIAINFYRKMDNKGLLYLLGEKKSYYWREGTEEFLEIKIMEREVKKREVSLAIDEKNQLRVNQLIVKHEKFYRKTHKELGYEGVRQELKAKLLRCYSKTKSAIYEKLELIEYLEKEYPEIYLGR